MLKQLAGNCEFHAGSATQMHLHLAYQQRHFLNDERQHQLQQALQDWSGFPIELKIEVVEQTLSETPLQRHKRHLKQLEDAAHRALQNDVRLQELMQTFDANIVPGSVSPSETESS